MAVRIIPGHAHLGMVSAFQLDLGPLPNPESLPKTAHGDIWRHLAGLRGGTGFWAAQRCCVGQRVPVDLPGAGLVVVRSGRAGKFRVGLDTHRVSRPCGWSIEDDGERSRIEEDGVDQLASRIEKLDSAGPCLRLVEESLCRVRLDEPPPGSAVCGERNDDWPWPIDHVDAPSRRRQALRDRGRTHDRRGGRRARAGWLAVRRGLNARVAAHQGCRDQQQSEKDGRRRTRGSRPAGLFHPPELEMSPSLEAGTAGGACPPMIRPTARCSGSR